MPNLEYQGDFEVSREELFAWHARDGAFQRLAPPWLAMRIVEKKGGIRDGDRLVFRVRRGPMPVKWEARHEGYEAGRRFVDVQERGPMHAWRHEHLFEDREDGGSRLRDCVDFEWPLFLPGNWGPLRDFFQRDMDRLFMHRHRQLREDLARHATLDPGQRPLRIAISGASGMIGSALTAFLRTGGHEVLPLRRRPLNEGEAGISWDPRQGRIEVEKLEGLDALVHLAGRSIVSAPWTASVRREIEQSRVQGTRLLAETLARLDQPPPVFVSASAMGFYGDDRGEDILTEQSPAGTSFLARVAQRWEAAADPARAAGIRVVHPRISLVLSTRGGALATMLPPFRLGLGGPLGNGRQWVSWISLDDLVGFLAHAICKESLEGPVNACSPEPLRQRDFARRLAALLRRPAILPAPAPLLKMLPGGMGRELMLASFRMDAAKALETGYAFREPQLEDCLRNTLGAWPELAHVQAPRRLDA